MNNDITMDISSIMGTLLSSESVSGVAEKTGASKTDVTSVLTSALPQLLSGANKQSEDKDTAEGFASALNQHAGSDTSSISSFLSKVDLSDGAKIVGHLLGNNGGSQVASNSGVSTSNTNSIMSAAAPLLMSLLGKQAQSSNNNSTSGSNVSGFMGSLLGKTDIAGLASSFLGGGKKSVEKTVTNTPINVAGGTTAKKPAAATAKTPKAGSGVTVKKTASTPAGLKSGAKKNTSVSGSKKSAGAVPKMGAATGGKRKTGASTADGVNAQSLADTIGNLLK